jgi:hypothetical protein
MVKWIYRLADNTFLRGGFVHEIPFDSAIEGLVELDEHPDIDRERFDSSSSTKCRPATQAELDTVATTTLDADAQSVVDGKAIKAAVLTALWGRLGRKPTAQEITAERTRFIGIYKAL